MLSDPLSYQRVNTKASAPAESEPTWLIDGAHLTHLNAFKKVTRQF
jgi:hypothetical protein